MFFLRVHLVGTNHPVSLEDAEFTTISAAKSAAAQSSPRFSERRGIAHLFRRRRGSSSLLPSHGAAESSLLFVVAVPTSSASASPASTMSPSSSSSGATHTIVQDVGFAAELRPCSLVEISGPEMIPPSDDAIMIRFMFYKETMHTFTETWAPYSQVQEYLMIPGSPTKAITVRPSEFYHQDAASIVKSPSGRMMIDFINTHFPPEDKQVLVPKLVAIIIELVQSSNPSETKAFVDVRRRDSIQIMHRFNGGEGVTYRGRQMHYLKAKWRTEGYFKATKRGTCAICMDDYEIERDDGIRLPCLHVFHGHCIYEWLMINPRCPVCSHTFTPALEPWFNPPLQDGIFISHSLVGLVDNQEISHISMHSSDGLLDNREISQEFSIPTHSSVGLVDNREISQELFVPTHYSVDSVHDQEISQELSVPTDFSVDSPSNLVSMFSNIWKFIIRL